MKVLNLYDAGKVESQLKTHPLVENICVYGDSFKSHTVAIMVPIKVRKLGNNLSIEHGRGYM